MGIFRLLFRLSRKNKFCNDLLRFFFACDIPMEAKIGNDVTFTHRGLGTVIHPKCVIEDHVWIEHHVLLGQRLDNESCAPIIQKNCVIGAYAIILGGVTIGEGSVIGAGAIITHDIPPHSIAYCKQEVVIKENTKPKGKF